MVRAINNSKNFLLSNEDVTLSSISHSSSNWLMQLANSASLSAASSSTDQMIPEGNLDELGFSEDFLANLNNDMHFETVPETQTSLQEIKKQSATRKSSKRAIRNRSKSVSEFINKKIKLTKEEAYLSSADVERAYAKKRDAEVCIFYCNGILN